MSTQSGTMLPPASGPATHSNVRSLLDKQQYSFLGSEVHQLGSTLMARRLKDLDWSDVGMQVRSTNANVHTEQAKLSILEGLGQTTIVSTGKLLKQYCTDVYSGQEGYIRAFHDRLWDGRWKVIAGPSSQASASTGPAFPF